MLLRLIITCLLSLSFLSIKANESCHSKLRSEFNRQRVKESPLDHLSLLLFQKKLEKRILEKCSHDYCDTKDLAKNIATEIKDFLQTKKRLRNDFLILNLSIGTTVFSMNVALETESLLVQYLSVGLGFLSGSVGLPLLRQWGADITKYLFNLAEGRNGKILNVNLSYLMNRWLKLNNELNMNEQISRNILDQHLINFKSDLRLAAEEYERGNFEQAAKIISYSARYIDTYMKEVDPTDPVLKETFDVYFKSRVSSDNFLDSLTPYFSPGLNSEFIHFWLQA